MDIKKAEKQAAEDSKTYGARYVVWVFDQGRDVYNAEQAKRYAPLIKVESVFVGGIKVADAAAGVAA